jgi:hypothetical protein
MNDLTEIGYDAQRLRILHCAGLALPRPIGETPAITIARLYPMAILVRLSGRHLPKAQEAMCALVHLPSCVSDAGALAAIGLQGVDTALAQEEAYRGLPLPERPFWSPIQTWAARRTGCVLLPVSLALQRDWIGSSLARGRPDTRRSQPANLTMEFRPSRAIHR